MANKTFLAVGCLHFPTCDMAFFEHVLDRVREVKPDYFINLGDFIDMDALSAFTGRKRPLSEDFGAARDALKAINEAAGDAKKVYLQGNHEERLWRSDNDHLTRALDYGDWPEMRGWKHIPYVNGPQGRFNLGQVVFAHGFAVGVGGCKKEAHYATNQCGLYVSAHTHRPHPVHEYRFGQTLSGKYHVNVGTGIDEEEVKLGYMKTKASNEWGSALVTGWSNTKRVVDTRCNWGCDYELYRMFEREPAREAVMV
jgi:predicted phosphodiesterase